MSTVFMNIFDVDVARSIHELIPSRPDVEWAAVEGSIFIYKTKHIVIYNGARKGAMCIFLQREEARMV